MRSGILAVALFLTTLTTQAADDTVYRINTGFVAPVADVYRLIIEEAFSRLGLKVDFREVPAERSIKLVDSGVDDGDCCRIWEINKTFPSLVPVPLEVINIDFVAFSNDPAVSISNWDTQAPYDVGVVHGWKILEVGLAQHPPRKVFTLTSPESMFSMLDKKRIQVATIDRLAGYKTATDLGLSGVRVHEPPLVSRPLYLQLHTKHRELVPKLTHILATMRAEGLLEQYYRQVVEPLEKNFQPEVTANSTEPQS